MRAKRSSAWRASRDGLEVVAPADDVLGLEALPDDVAVFLRFPADLLEDGFDVQELEGCLASFLERRVEAVVDGAIQARGLSADRQHVDAHDQEAGLRDPGLVIGGVPALAVLGIAVRVEQRTKLLPGRRSAFEQERQHGHEVRLAAAEAAMDDAPVFFAAIEDLLHAVEDARNLASRRQG